MESRKKGVNAAIVTTDVALTASPRGEVNLHHIPALGQVSPMDRNTNVLNQEPVKSQSKASQSQSTVISPRRPRTPRQPTHTTPDPKAVHHDQRVIDDSAVQSHPNYCQIG